MHKLTFFPLGNADSCRIDLEGGEKEMIMHFTQKGSDAEITVP